MNSEIKVGILFFIGLGLLLWFTIFVTQIGTSRGEYAIRFPRVEKLKEGDQVTYNGVRGTDGRFHYDAKAETRAIF